MANISRSVSALLRTGRFALQRPRGVNPIRHALLQDRTAFRGMATVFERSKPHVNVGELNLVYF